MNEYTIEFWIGDSCHETTPIKAESHAKATYQAFKNYKKEKESECPYAPTPKFGEFVRFARAFKRGNI